jgi:hypothetical protein
MEHDQRGSRGIEHDRLGNVAHLRERSRPVVTGGQAKPGGAHRRFLSATVLTMAAACSQCSNCHLAQMVAQRTQYSRKSLARGQHSAWEWHRFRILRLTGGTE